MAPKGIEMSLVLVVVLMLWGGAAAQSGCNSALMGLSPCLNYVTGNSSKPSSSCCSNLANVVQSQPLCLCVLVNSGAASQLGVTINQTLALGLPGVCNVQTPSISKCNGTGGSKTVPTTSGSTSNGSMAKLPHLTLFVSLIFAGFSTFIGV